MDMKMAEPLTQRAADANKIKRNQRIMIYPNKNMPTMVEPKVQFENAALQVIL